LPPSAPFHRSNVHHFRSPPLPGGRRRVRARKVTPRRPVLRCRRADCTAAGAHASQCTEARVAAAHRRRGQSCTPLDEGSGPWSPGATAGRRPRRRAATGTGRRGAPDVSRCQPLSVAVSQGRGRPRTETRQQRVRPARTASLQAVALLARGARRARLAAPHLLSMGTPQFEPRTRTGTAGPSAKVARPQDSGRRMRCHCTPPADLPQRRGGAKTGGVREAARPRRDRRDDDWRVRTISRENSVRRRARGHGWTLWKAKEAPYFIPCSRDASSPSIARPPHRTPTHRGGTPGAHRRMRRNEDGGSKASVARPPSLSRLLFSPRGAGAFGREPPQFSEAPCARRRRGGVARRREDNVPPGFALGVPPAAAPYIFSHPFVTGARKGSPGAPLSTRRPASASASLEARR
jgi:hypothetical protein